MSAVPMDWIVPRWRVSELVETLLSPGACEVVVTWLGDHRFLDHEGAPAMLSLVETESPSFQRLVQAASPYLEADDVLMELARMGLVEQLATGRVMLRRSTYGPGNAGPVSGFSSVIVNGIRFVTENLGIDDFTGEAGVSTEEDLEKGMILQIRGEWEDDGQGEAESVRYDDTLRGPVTAVPEPWDRVTRQGRIEVMGFEVILDRLTQTTLDDLRDIGVDESLRISGWLREDGIFRASYVGPVSSGDRGQEIEGNLSVTGEEPNQRYLVNGLELKIPSGAVCDGLQLADGASVDVEGEYFSGAAFTVSRICNGPASFLDASLDEDVQVAGVVTNAFTGDRDDGRFTLNGIPVTTNKDTDFDDLEPSDISGGVLLQVEGQYISDNGDRALWAEEIEYRDADAEVEGPLDEVDGSVLRVGGVEVRLTSATIRDDDECSLPFEQQVGQITVEVAGVQRSADGGYLQALEIECDDGVNGGEYALEGRIDVDGIDENAMTITILGATIRVDGNTDFGSTEFGSLSDSDKLEVLYTREAGELLAQDIDLDD